MITKGVSDIKGVHSLNTKPGPITESSGHLKLYQLAAERDNLMKKLVWVKQQGDRTKRRLSEIAHGMHMMKRVVEERSKRESTLNANPGLRNAFIRY